MVLEAVDVLELLSSSLSLEDEEEKSSGDAFLKSSVAETLPEKHLMMQHPHKYPLEWTYLPALELE